MKKMHFISVNYVVERSTRVVKSLQCYSRLKWSPSKLHEEKQDSGKERRTFEKRMEDKEKGL
jgi:hypothetical protein